MKKAIDYGKVKKKKGVFQKEKNIEYAAKESSSQKSLNKIGRIVFEGQVYDEDLEETLKEFLRLVDKKTKFEFLIMPGGLLHFYFSKKLSNYSNSKAEENLEDFYKEAESRVIAFFRFINPKIFQRLKQTANYLTIGIDGCDIKETNRRWIELVAIYSLQTEQIIRWTGKFYPTQGQKSRLIKINDLNSHFIRINNENVVILGCHDLNIFNPRGQASLCEGSLKKKLSDEFKSMMKKFKPEIVLHHPHTTDTPNIWNIPWKTLKKEFPAIKHFASGINYYNYKQEVREKDLSKVLKLTREGDVIDFKNH